MMITGTNDLKMLLADSPLEAPSYKLPEYKAVNLTKAQIVGQGTVDGNPTVDFIFEDEDGQKYVALITGGLVEMLTGAIKGMRERTKP